MIQEINHLISLGNLAEALKLVDAAVDEHDDYYLFHEKRAEILISSGDRKGAAQSLRKAIKRRPDLQFLQQRLAALTTKNAAADKETDQEAGPAPRRFCGIHERAPDTTFRRKAEGGLRLKGQPKSDKEQHPLVSIITVVFNNPGSLERCLLSVRNQDYPNLEHIIIDGGSENPTLEIIRKYEDSIDYYVSEPDGGIYQAMNKGIRLANGRYVCLLNSDDSYLPSFVSKTVSVAEQKQGMLVSTNYIHGETALVSSGANSGIFFGHLNLNHCTFLVSRYCYDLVGPYREDLQIVSDVIWMSRAFKKGVHFHHVSEPLMIFAAGGLSSGGNASHRNLLISEIVKSYCEEFTFLHPKDAEKIYLLRFDPHKLKSVLATAEKHASDRRFIEALSNYVKYCLRDRENFRLKDGESSKQFQLFLKACIKLEIPKNSIRVSTKSGCFSDIILAIDRAIALRKPSKVRTILHFATVFSAPSETFIYDLLIRLENQTAFDNFILFDCLKLEEIRPFAKGFWVPWADFSPQIRNAIYQHIFESLRPDVIVGHFALNTWKLAQRIKPLGIRIPTLSMTHGIDVFELQKEGDYRKYILKQGAGSGGNRFTTVSHYLRDKLVEFGVPAHKIDIVHNSINPRFREHHKPGQIRNPGDPLKMLAIGRLIDWKGHRHLLEAVHLAKSRTSAHLSLTIVYANGDGLLETTSDQIQQLDLQSQVKLVPFVDFKTEPDFFTRYDLFVHPSTYGGEKSDRTETFGMSVLEAIAAGLPVIVTDVGGLPEVVGKPGQFARIVRHGDAESLADAICEAVEDPARYEDNQLYADERLARFSERNQLLAFAKSILRVTKPGIRAALFSTSTLRGAGYAAFRLHNGMRAGDVITPRLHTTLRYHKKEPGIRVIPHPTMKDTLWRTLQQPTISNPSLTIFTVNHPIITNDKLAELIENADIINLHWSARFLSIENIAYLTHSGKPVVLTIRDMFPITGGCHYFHGCSGWKENCDNCPQLIDHWENYPAKVLAAKRSHYNFKNLTIVTLSRHSADILREAPFFKDCRIEIIPNSIETDVFRPLGRRKSREELGLPLDRHIIAFVPSSSSEIKGYFEAAAALGKLKQSHPDLNPLILLVGRGTTATNGIPFEKHALGYIQETDSLAFAYSAADLVIVPSLEETFSNTTAEAIACGTPVVGFKTGAIPELVIDGLTGYTVEIGDIEGFADGMFKVLTGPDMSANCRKLAEENLRFDLQARRYEDLFTDLLTMRPSSVGDDRVGIAESFPETTATIVKLLGKISAT